MSTEGKVTTDNVVVAKVDAMKTVNGKNAYEMAVLHGYTGTFEDWIESIASGRLTDGHKEAIADSVVEKYKGGLVDIKNTLALEVANEKAARMREDERIESLIGADATAVENSYNTYYRRIADSVDESLGFVNPGMYCEEGVRTYIENGELRTENQYNYDTYTVDLTPYIGAKLKCKSSKTWDTFNSKVSYALFDGSGNILQYGDAVEISEGNVGYNFVLDIPENANAIPASMNGNFVICVGSIAWPNFNIESVFDISKNVNALMKMVPAVDNTVTEGSTNPVSGDAVYEYGEKIKTEIPTVDGIVTYGSGNPVSGDAVSKYMTVFQEGLHSYVDSKIGDIDFSELQEQIGDKFNIVAEKTGRNVLDKTKFENGWLVDGGTVSNAATWVTSDYIPITDLAYCCVNWNGTGVTYAKPRKLCLYDENKAYISGTYIENASATGTFSTEGAAYVRISVAESQTETIMLLLGDTTISNISEYIPYSVTKIYGLSEKVDVSNKISGKQDVLVSGQNIKTINGESIIGSGNVEISSFELYEERQNRNMLDKTKFEPGWLVDGGTIYNQASWVTSDYIPITKDIGYCSCVWNETQVTYAKPRKLCLYDENKAYISGTYIENANATGTFSTEGAAYVRISVASTQIETIMLLLGDTTTDGITGYIPYGVTRYYKIPNNVVLRPKFKVVAAGDSITYGSKQAGDGYADMTDGVSYMTNACKKLGFELENYSLSASTLGLASDGTNPRQALIERYTEMSDNADLVYIAMGTNDWFYQFELGEMADRTKTTFYGALHLLCQGLKDKYPTTPIVFATPIKRYIIRSGEPAGNLNMKSQELDLWRVAIKEVCEYHSIPVVDMYAESFLNAWDESERTKYLPDGTHPNGAGHKKMQITCEAVLNKYLGDYYI